MERRSKGPMGPRKRITNQRSFEIELKPESENNLLYFIKQELGLYNSLVEQLIPRLRSFPQDFATFKEKERRLWEGCAEHAADIRKMIDHPVDQWPEKLRYLEPMLRDANGATRITPGHAQMITTACSPARLHPSVRKIMAADVLKYMIDQSEVILAGSKTDTLKSPLQMLNTHTLDTKRHLQIPSSLVTMRYDNEKEGTLINVPYTKHELVVHGYDLTEISYKLMMVRAPHASNPEFGWRIELKDGLSYHVNATDHFDRRRK